MKLIDAIKFKGKPFEVKDCSRDELPVFLKEMGLTTGAEIGVYKAAYTEKFCQQGLKMYAIDPWMAFPGQGRTQQRQERQDFLYGHAKRVLDKYPNCQIIRKTSVEAVKDFEPRSLDFVYIDGDHRFPFVAHDIYEWYWRVKKGGIIAGHDYFCTIPEANNVLCHVRAVINAFVETMGIESFWTFGRSKPLDQEAKDDKFLSWMFFKR